MRALLIILIVCGFTFHLNGQDKALRSLDSFFTDYAVGVVSPENKKATKSSGTIEWDLLFGPLKGETLVLWENDLLRSSHQISTQTKSLDMTESLKTYSGYLASKPSQSVVRITEFRDQLIGAIEIGTETFYLEPTDKIVKSSRAENHIIYNEKDVIIRSHVKCVATEVHSRKNIESKRTLKSNGCRIYEIAIAGDFSYVQEHGSVAGAIAQSTAIMNLVAGDYDHPFSDAIQFEIVEHWMSDCSTCDPWTTSSFANDLLSSFTSWGPTGFNMNHDIGQLWTDRDVFGVDTSGNPVFGVAGLASLNAVCSNNRYHILEDFINQNSSLRVLTSHEIGHNFGGTHDPAMTQFIMSPVVTQTNTWSSVSQNTINNSLVNFDCFDQCFIGSCSDIVNVNVSACNPTTSRYELTLIIEHNGGGSSSSFNIIVNNQSFNQLWLASPQTVIIRDLIADGTIDNSVIVQADDGSDDGCNGSRVFNEPPSDCSLNLFVDFNDCALPAGWTESSTNTINWIPPSGVDPDEIQWEWKFDDADRFIGNYGAASNSSSLLTIDGSCMAYMDDDIFSSPASYSGIITLTTDVLNTSLYDDLSLSFDYIFHPFESGATNKNPNESFFEVQVFDGNTWVQILLQVNSDCPWFDIWQSDCLGGDSDGIDLSSYRNQNFQIRFIYSDGHNPITGEGVWAGMIALDNVSIIGTVTPSGPCENTITLASPITESSYAARNLITTSGAIIVSQNLHLSAPNVELRENFTVETNTILTVENDGCN